MIFGGEFVNGIDLVDVFLWAFTLFFFGLIFYLRREDRREGYPLEADTTGRLEDSGVLWYAPKKTFTLPHGAGTVSVPHGKRDERQHAMKRMAVWPGAPYTPTGDPLQDGVGPAAFAERNDTPDLADDGRNRIAPTRLGDGFEVARQDADPRGMTVIAGDGVDVGTVVDLWVDRSEAVVRYLELNIGDEAIPHHILLPMPFAKINRSKNSVEVDAIFAKHFPNVPKTKSSDAVTRREEDQISGYYGGGKLYASRERLESLL